MQAGNENMAITMTAMSRFFALAKKLRCKKRCVIDQKEWSIRRRFVCGAETSRGILYQRASHQRMPSGLELGWNSMGCIFMVVSFWVLGK